VDVDQHVLMTEILDTSLSAGVYDVMPLLNFRQAGRRARVLPWKQKSLKQGHSVTGLYRINQNGYVSVLGDIS